MTTDTTSDRRTWLDHFPTVQGKALWAIVCAVATTGATCVMLVRAVFVAHDIGQGVIALAGLLFAFVGGLWGVSHFDQKVKRDTAWRRPDMLPSIAEERAKAPVVQLAAQSVAVSSAADTTIEARTGLPPEWGQRDLALEEQP